MTLAALKMDDSYVAAKDSVGGFARIDKSDIYNLTIEVAYLETTPTGTMNVHVHFKTDQGANLRERYCVAGTSAKGNKNYTLDPATGKKRPFRGMAMVNDLSLLTVGVDISELDPEEKMVKLYDFTARAEVPTKVQMFTALVGKQVKAGIQLSIEDKTGPCPSGSGKWVNTGDSYNATNVTKFFRTRDDMSVVEISAEATEANFIDVWIGKHQGTTPNNAKGIDGKPATPPQTKGASASSAPAESDGKVKSLFA